MKLDNSINYIVSGLERSGTSMLMQLLRAGRVPIAYDEKRKPDKNNVKGYYELEGGKIINKLIQGTIAFDKYKGKFIKITSFGLKYLPIGNYKIIYSERDIEEIMDSMERMMGTKDDSRNDTKKSFVKLNEMIKKQIKSREDIDSLFVNYNEIIKNPDKNIKKIQEYLNMPDEVFDDMLRVIDRGLYRNRKE